MTEKRGPGRPVGFDRGEFIRTWNGSKSVDEVCSRLGLLSHVACGRASRLRSTGEDLQLFPRGRKPQNGSVPVVRRPSLQHTGELSDRARDFIRIWNASASLAEVADRTGLTAPSARAWGLRQAGHDLKRFKRGRKSRA